MYIVVTNTVTYQATTDKGALAQINWLEVKDIKCFAGPWTGEAVMALHAAFPEAIILTNKPIPSGLKNCYSLPAANFATPTSPALCYVAGVKGGVGKTTLAALAAFCLSKMDTVCVIDLDEQAGFTTICNIASDEEKYDVRYVAQNILLVPNRRGDVAPMSGAPPGIVGGALGAAYVIADYGNRARFPNTENTILVTGVGEDIFRQTIHSLGDFRGVVAIMPIHNESKKDKERMKQRIVEEAKIPSQKVVALPFIPVDPWRPVFLELEKAVRVPEIYNSVMEVLRAAGVVEQPGKEGSDRGKRRFLGL